jgi:hypothetical protein
VQGTERLATGSRLVGALGVLARALLIEGDDCVDLWIDLVDAIELQLEQFQCADLLVAQHAGQVAYGQKNRRLVSARHASPTPQLSENRPFCRA